MEESRFLEEVVEMEYTRSPGKVAGRFLSELRDNAEIIGIRCSKCSKVFVPPQGYCPDCHVKMQSYVPMPAEGTIAYSTVVKKKLPFTDWQPPFAYVGIKFDGAHTVLWHRMKSPDGAKAGAKVKPVFKPEDKREGSLLDIDYFEIVK